MKDDVFDFVKQFEKSGYIAPGCNSSFITLIPKTSDPLNLGDYRPISLIGCMYKIIAKLLANRLKQVLGSVVDEVQSAYIEGRNILDGPLIMNEVLSWAKRSNKKIFMFKVDFEKAFDSVNWNYLDSIMEQLNFGGKWRWWIRGCLSSSRTSVLVNGSPTEEFVITKGVRQGDPLSPFLFIIAMEGLNQAINKARELGLLTGIGLPGMGPTLSHMFYADDAIFVGEWDRSSIKNLSALLKCFHISSGLKVNFFKSRLFGVGILPSELQSMANILGCATGTFSFNHLGIPVGANMGLIKHWQPILDKFKSRLSDWKAKTLSFGGRLTLIKSVLNSLPSYYLSLFKAPQGIIDQLEKIRRNFMWGGGELKRKIHWIDWSKVIAPIADGGLDISTLKAQNLALLIKWWWRLMNKNNTLWKRVIVSIHNLSKKPATYIARKTSSGVWNNIQKAINALESLHIDYHDYFNLIPNGNVKILFWKDSWCGKSPFQVKYPHLYKLEKVKCCLLSNRLTEAGFTWDWRHEPSSGVELHELLGLYRDIGDMVVTNTSRSYGFSFSLTSDGEYKVGDMRRMIDSKLTSYKGSVICWSKLIPLKVRCFVWRATFGCIPVADSLNKRGVQTQSQHCPMCGNERETATHLLLDCEFAQEAHKWIFKWCGFQPRRFNSMLDFLDSMASGGNRCKRRLIGSMILYCTIWSIWLARNDRVFKNSFIASTNVADSIILISYNWYRYRSSLGYGSWAEWCCSPFEHFL
ncbi:uncharacterized protein LOC128127842 [Lactuca sativa]|uniref:uncharacterized protein LOC128127842 n=1 Tax=Lactuca sativa TaxID=4236 RepID=UPI0022AF1761|nr:uncharacterized protein LOC128127842 [Lactuca sativa]